jgi:hypothetical protein
VLIAFGADVQIVFQVLFPDDLPAVLTLYPQSLGADFLFARSIELAGLSFEPNHLMIANRQITNRKLTIENS